MDDKSRCFWQFRALAISPLTGGRCFGYGLIMGKHGIASARSLIRNRAAMSAIFVACAAVAIISVSHAGIFLPRLEPAAAASRTGQSNSRRNRANPNQCSERNKASRIQLDPNGTAQVACPDGKCDFRPVPQWYISVDVVGMLSLRDSHGRTDTLFTGEPRAQTIPSVTYTPLCRSENCLLITLPTTERYTLTFTAKQPDEPILLEVLRGVGNLCPDEAVRYLDISLPKNSTAKLDITPQAVTDLRIDHGDGRFNSIAPTARVFAPAAWDIEGPFIKFSSQADKNSIVVRILAQDVSGVSRIFYSVDGGPPFKYEKPFKLDPAAAHEIAAFADDKVGNRSDLYTYRTKP